MLSIRKINPAARAIGTVGAVVALAGGVTFAALQSQATLTGNTIASATATLEVSNSPGCGVNTGTFSQSEPGFAFTRTCPRWG